MAYIYKKTIGRRPYYYLRISKRIKGKIVTKDIAYLGNDPLKIQEKLSKLSQYDKEIRKGYKNIKRFVEEETYLKKAKGLKLKKDLYLNKDVLEQIEAIRMHYNKHFLKLPKKTIEETYKNFIIDFSFNTTSIEGNTITLHETQRLLEENILPSNKTLREVYDLQNTEKTFFWLLGQESEINEELIIQTHDLLLDRIDKRKGYRIHDVRVFKSRFKSSPVNYISTDMKLLIKWFEKNKKKLHPIVLASMFHHKLEKIHPFADGNGRTGRLLLNHILMKNNYPPLIIQKKRRREYLDVLNKADSSGIEGTETTHYQKLVEYIANEFINSYWNNFNI